MKIRLIAIALFLAGYGAVSLVAYRSCTKATHEYTIWMEIKEGMSREEVVVRLQTVSYKNSSEDGKEMFYWRDRGFPSNHDFYVYLEAGRVVEKDIEQ